MLRSPNSKQPQQSVKARRIFFSPTAAPMARLTPAFEPPKSAIAIFAASTPLGPIMSA
jgi:hypothetical protein